MNRKILCVPIAILLLGLLGGTSGCAAAGAVPANDVAYPETAAFDDYEKQWAIRESNPVSEETIARVNGFACRTGNVLLSGVPDNANYAPLSLYYALSLLSEGASGETREQLYTALGGEQPGQELDNLMRRLYTDNEVGALRMANAVWMQEGLSFEQAFCDTAAERYFAALFYADFSNPNTGKAIGDWIARKTGGQLAPEMTTAPEQIMMILNTVSFRDEWMDAFQNEQTANGVFHAESGDLTAAFMHAARTGGAVRGNGFVRAALPLKNAGRMLFVLPDADVGLRELLGSAGLETLLCGGEEVYSIINWSVPKFRFDSSFDLAPMLKALGVTAAFRPDAAFDGIHADAFVSAVRQETHIGVDEKGVEAAAFTRIDVAGAADVEPPRVDMALDRPFLYAVTAANGALLFIGVVANPMA